MYSDYWAYVLGMQQTQMGNNFDYMRNAFNATGAAGLGNAPIENKNDFDSKLLLLLEETL